MRELGYHIVKLELDIEALKDQGRFPYTINPLKRH